MTHTPGPWFVRDLKAESIRAEHRYEVRHSATGNHPVCDVFYVTDVGAANARLIAAAPDLLAACKEALLALDGRCAMNSREIITSAIAKAEAP